MSEAAPPAASNPPGGRTEHGEPVAALPSRSRSPLLLALAAGLLAGIASWAIGEAVRTAFRPPLHGAGSDGPGHHEGHVR